jgi:Flp pilus assembly protein protease CpaA
MKDFKSLIINYELIFALIIKLIYIQDLKSLIINSKIIFILIFVQIYTN